MENTGNKIFTEENLTISAKLDSVFMREKELMLFKEIVGAKVQSTNFNQSAFPYNPKLIFSILGTVLILFLGIFLITTNTSKKNVMTDKINFVNDVTIDDNLTNENTIASVEKNEGFTHSDKAIDKPTDKSIDKPRKSSKFDDNKTEDDNNKVKDGTNYSNANLGNQSGKAIDVKIIDGYEVSSRESVVSTGILLIENADISKLKIKVSEILTNFKLKNTFNSSDVLNITSDKYVGELKNGQIVLFNIQFKIFKENPTKLQVMLRYNQILNPNEVKKSEAINIDKLFYNSLKQEITQKLTQFLK